MGLNRGWWAEGRVHPSQATPSRSFTLGLDMRWAVTSLEVQPTASLHWNSMHHRRGGHVPGVCQSVDQFFALKLQTYKIGIELG